MVSCSFFVKIGDEYRSIGRLGYPQDIRLSSAPREGDVLTVETSIDDITLCVTRVDLHVFVDGAGFSSERASIYCAPHE